MSHAQEPWHISDYPMDNLAGEFLMRGIPVEKWKQAVDAVNNCIGLNPVAYRECVAALVAAQTVLMRNTLHNTEAYFQVTKALARAQESA